MWNPFGRKVKFEITDVEQIQKADRKRHQTRKFHTKNYGIYFSKGGKVNGTWKPYNRDNNYYIDERGVLREVRRTV